MNFDIVGKITNMDEYNLKPRFVVCIKNQDYPVSLELRKIYQVIPDTWASENQQIRIIDETGEDYLYPMDYFVPIELPESVEEIFAQAT